MESEMGSSIQVPQSSPPPPGWGPLPPHSISSTHTEWCWVIEGFPTPVSWAAERILRAWSGGPGELRLGGTDAKQTELHIWP